MHTCILGLAAALALTSTFGAFPIGKGAKRVVSFVALRGRISPAGKRGALGYIIAVKAKLAEAEGALGRP